MNSSVQKILYILITIWIIIVTANCKKDNNDSLTPIDTVWDIDGNIYHFDTIGDQIWMRENLKVTRFRNGDSVPQVKKSNEWIKLNTPAYCNSKNSDSLANIYGRLYNWYVIDDPRNISPEGWHVATYPEWMELVNFLGGDKIAGGKLKETDYEHWKYNCKATNESGFTALPGGYRSYSNGACNSVGLIGYWWANTEIDSSLAVGCRMNNYDATFLRRGEFKDYGFSIRCIKD